MEYLIICTVSFFVSGLTLFSGFGLGTLLMPCFALFFPLEAAVALTAVVHFSANLWKFVLMGRFADRRALIFFGLPAALFAFAGAWLLGALSHFPPVYVYEIVGRAHEVTPVKLIMAFLIAGFAFLELWPRFSELSFPRSMLPLGGALSGFFGGLSGHQGALRSAFLSRSGLNAQAFIGTGVVIACLVDAARLLTYQRTLDWAGLSAHAGLLIAAVAAAFLGVGLARRYTEKVTIKTLQRIIAVLLGLTAAGLAAGLI